ncbi:thiamine pyrophosphate-dependent enzyme [Bradyrhizobium sp. LHD-71]|uniref:thiamine pyrophosphate-dependent enzyme n=1 Tax=Bradyrhizobium sp. LHD-71 TaxID=3072141 RepID=UPI00280C51D0|nr:thiamine pyrophosphate-dependent enzyme [Bradyrhizobium sp. LHD-71]MDQ8728315.1 thiamine pyrophosphate-dependent enzyme [Bradyrhizobium sp. LHD-71]
MATSNKINRRPFVATLLAQRGNALVIPGLGSPTWDCSAAGDSPEYLYSWGGMGLAVPTALGVALARPDRRVLALTGDGEMLMGIGSLGVVSAQGAKNLSILVLDNESFGETGRQTGLTSERADLCAVARGFGISRTMHVTEQGKADELASFLFKEEGPCFAVAKIALSEDPWSLPVKDGTAIARRFRIALGVEKA